MSYDQKESDFVPMKTVINNVKKMARDSSATKIASSEKLAINTVSYEDCARNKFSVWGPCISDMTLQVNNERMPVIREPNYTDKTWDVELDKIPLVVGNHDPNPGAKLKTISLREYLENFNDYMSTPPKKGKKLNLIANDMFAKQSDKHVVMSSQCCFLPIEKGKETKFNVALFNYQSRKSDPAVLVIVSTSKGTSAQIIEGNEQKLLFNNYGRKADFIGQRLTDNRIERGVSIHGAMTTQEKQDNCIVIIQIPLKQKPKQVHVHSTQVEYNYVPQPYGAPSYPPQGFDPFGPPPNFYGANPYMNQNQNYNPYMGAQMNQMNGGGNPYMNNLSMVQNMSNIPTLSPAPHSLNFSNGGGYNQQAAQSTSAHMDFAPSADFSAPMSGGFGSAAQPQSAASDCFDFINDDNNHSNAFTSNTSSQYSAFGWDSNSNSKPQKKKAKKKKPDANIEAAIVKIAPKTIPTCICGGNLDEVELRHCYGQQGGVSCDGCGKSVQGSYTKVWHCPKEKSSYKHSNGYDLCHKCGEKQLSFDELNGLPMIERDERYPIRVTLQYYKSTDNGILDKDIMKAIKTLLEKSQKQADFVGSLVTDFSIRSTEADLVTKNKKEIIHHVNKVKVNVPVPVYNPYPIPVDPFGPGVVIKSTKVIKKDVIDDIDPFEGMVNDMKHQINHGKYHKIATALTELIAKEDDRNKYLQNFKDEEVTDEDLPNLCRDDLMELIPKMGPRNRFLKWLKSEYSDKTDTNFMSGFL